MNVLRKIYHFQCSIIYERPWGKKKKTQFYFSETSAPIRERPRILLWKDQLLISEIIKKRASCAALCALAGIFEQ